MAVTSLLLAGCGSRASDTDAASAESCVDASGPNIKVGSLNSLSPVSTYLTVRKLFLGQYKVCNGLP